jgi:hypothetical protein
MYHLFAAASLMAACATFLAWSTVMSGPYWSGASARAAGTAQDRTTAMKVIKVLNLAVDLISLPLVVTHSYLSFI